MKLDTDFWSKQILIAEVLANVGFVVCTIWFLVLPVFFYPNAEANLKHFASAAGLVAVDCINGDSDRDWNLSCTARNKDLLLTVSCGYMPWAKGCKINVGKNQQPQPI